MRTINPVKFALSQRSKDSANKTNPQSILRESARFKTSTHKYARTFSGIQNGEEKVMGYEEAMALNKIALRKYIKEIEKGIQARSLEQWIVVERFAHE